MDARDKFAGTEQRHIRILISYKFEKAKSAHRGSNSLSVACGDGERRRGVAVSVATASHGGALAMENRQVAGCLFADQGDALKRNRWPEKRDQH